MRKPAFYLLATAAWLLLPPGMAFALENDTRVYVPSNYYTFQPPLAGGSYTDPVFGTSIKRISNARGTISADTGQSLNFITDEYSTMSPFNSDNSRILLVFQSYFAIFDGNGNFIKHCPLEINSSSEPRWSRTNANQLYYIRGNQLKLYDASTDVVSVVHTFSEYSSISGKGESDVSLGGDHFVFAGDNRYVFVYQISTDTKGRVLDALGNGFDSLYITPNNNVTITWLRSGTNRFNGIEMFDGNMNFQRQLAHAGGHMDITRDSNGDEVLVWTNSADPAPPVACNNGIVKIRLSDAAQSCLVQLDWSLAVHISAPDNNGWAFVETYAPSDPDPSTPAWKVYTNEILQVKLDGTEVRRLLHHRSRPFNSYNYMPRTSVSRDGSRFVYSSDCSLQTTLGYPADYSDVYLVLVPGSTTGSTGGSGGTGGGGPGGGTGGSTGGTTPGTVTRYEQGNSAAQYTGAWFSNNLSAGSGGSAALAVDIGSRATFSFTGASVSWIGYRDQWSGVADVYLDGQLQTTVDTYSSTDQAQAVIFTATGLSSGSHTLVIQVTGTHSSNSAGSWVWVDAFDVTSGSSGGTTGGTGSTSSTVTHFEQDNSAVSYMRTWFPNANSLESGGSAALAGEKGSRAIFTFTGTGVSWIGYRDQSCGFAHLYLDGIFVATIDTYASTAMPQAVIRTIPGLARGTHTLVIQVAGRRSNESGGNWVWVDAFEVVP